MTSGFKALCVCVCVVMRWNLGALTVRDDQCWRGITDQPHLKVTPSARQDIGIQLLTHCTLTTQTILVNISTLMYVH